MENVHQLYATTVTDNWEIFPVTVYCKLQANESPSPKKINFITPYLIQIFKFGCLQGTFQDSPPGK